MIRLNAAPLIVAALLAGLAPAARAEEPAELVPAAPGAVTTGTQGRKSLRGAIFSSPGRKVDASEALDEMIDELAADISRNGLARLGPILLERVRLSENLSPGFAATLEARIAAALSRSTSVAVVRCTECWTTRARVEDAAWVVTRGLARKEDVQRVAQTSGARSFLAASLSVQPDAGTMALDVEVVRADGGAIAFAESYRFNAEDALLYRGADRAQSRAARLKELEDRVEARPTWGHGAYLGIMRVPGNLPDTDVIGPYGSYELFEQFGEDRRYRFGIRLGGFFDSKNLAGGVIGGAFSVRLTPRNVWNPELRVGVMGGGFLTGNGGNTSIFTAGAELQMGARLAAFANLGYMAGLQIKGQGPTYGGFVQQLGVAFLWN
jgi:hypothetical protein